MIEERTGLSKESLSLQQGVSILSALLNDAETGQDIVQTIPEEAEFLRRFAEQIWEIRELALSLSRGDIRYQSAARGITAGSLKALQANLRHLTWQTECIARGDFSQRVRFMGEFATAFNEMSSRLCRTLNELTVLSDQYRMLSYQDTRTGLPNRRAFFDAALREIRRSVRTQREACFISVDIDFFSLVNERYGHDFGNTILQQFANRLTSSLREEDVCSRFTADQFTIMLYETNAQHGGGVAERLCEVVRSQPFVGDPLLSLTASFGVSAFIPSRECQEVPAEEILDTVLRQAEQAMARARELGRNQVYVWNGAFDLS